MDKIRKRLSEIDRLIVLHPEKLRPSTKISPHFSLREVVCKDTSQSFLGNLPPSIQLTKITNFTETLFFLETLRLFIGKPLSLSSVYRSVEYNKSIGGVSRSAHVLFKAADVHNPVQHRFTGREYDNFYAQCEKVADHLEKVHGCFIRLGKYSRAEDDFVHVDCDRSKFSKRWGK